MRNLILLLFAAALYSCTTPENIVIDGILEVPENRENSNSRTLNLVYKVLKAKKPDSLKVPIVYLMGGPGGATLVMEEFWKNHPLRDDRDIVLMDQRGTGASEANCTGFGEASFAILRQNLDKESEIRALEVLMSECKKTMRLDGIDLAGYSSKENAADFDDLRKALGYKKWNLFGASYGTRLGLTIMRDFPNGVRSSVLAGVLAPETNILNSSIENFENSLLSVFDRCEKNADCNNRYPNLKERLVNVLKKLHSKPLHMEYEGKPFVLNSQDALLLSYVSLYEHNSIGNIPLLIEAFENGDPEPIKNALKSVESLYKFLNWSMNYSVMVYEELPFYDAVAMKKSAKESKIVVFDSVSFELSDKIVANWHSFRATAFENQPVISEIPTLMATGGLDHVTPPSNATEALKHLQNGYSVVFPDESHNLLGPCFFQIAEDFLNNPYQKSNTDCSTKSYPIKWKLN